MVNIKPRKPDIACAIEILAYYVDTIIFINLLHFTQ